MSKNDIKKTILAMAFKRGEDKSICPSEVAREMFGDNWRAQMQNIRDAAFDLAAQNQVVVTQKGENVEAEGLKGPIRIRIKNQKNRD